MLIQQKSHALCVLCNGVMRRNYVYHSYSCSTCVQFAIGSLLDDYLGPINWRTLTHQLLCMHHSLHTATLHLQYIITIIFLSLETLSVLGILWLLVIKAVKVLGSEGGGEEVCQFAVLMFPFWVDQDNNEVGCCKLQKGTVSEDCRACSACTSAIKSA